MWKIRVGKIRHQLKGSGASPIHPYRPLPTFYPTSDIEIRRVTIPGTTEIITKEDGTEGKWVMPDNLVYTAVAPRMERALPSQSDMEIRDSHGRHELIRVQFQTSLLPERTHLSLLWNNVVTGEFQGNPSDETLSSIKGLATKILCYALHEMLSRGEATLETIITLFRGPDRFKKKLSDFYIGLGFQEHRPKDGGMHSTVWKVLDQCTKRGSLVDLQVQHGFSRPISNLF